MKIAFYTVGWFTGGMENAVYHLGKLLSLDGHKLFAISKVSNAQTEKMENKMSEYFTFIKYEDGFECDVLINTSRNEIELPLIKSNKIIHSFYSNLVQNVDKILPTSKVVCQSKWHYDNLVKLGIKEPLILGNPLDVDYILELSNEKIDEFSKKDETVYLVVSRISPEKGFRRMIDFMIRHYRENSRLFIVGGVTQERNENIKTSLEKGLHQKVVFLGEKENPYPYIKKANYILCLSDAELYGLVSEESHILGKQVIFNKYATAYDQFILGFDSWHDGKLVYLRECDKIDNVEYHKIINKDRLRKWKEIIENE